MRKTILILPDGKEISSGAGTREAIVSCQITQCVNAGSELTLGSVCAAMAELQLITPDGSLALCAGDELTICHEEDGVRRQVGIFLAEKPERPTANTLRITAYDRVTRLDQDLTGWLNALSGWPYTLRRLAELVCQACGVELTDAPLPNGSFLVEQFTAQAVTGRKLLQWIGQVAGRFCRANADGTLEFAWYTPAESSVSWSTPRWQAAGETLTLHDPVMQFTGSVRITVPDAAITADGTQVTVSYPRRLAYNLGGLQAADYAVAPIDKVQLHASQEDVGVVYPADETGTHAYQLTANPLLMGRSAEALQTVAQTLYTQLQQVTYTPCTLRLPANSQVAAGQILPVTDKNGRRLTLYVMQRKCAGQVDILSCTGSHRRDSTTAVNDAVLEGLNGRVLNLHMDMEGLRAENKASDGRLASLELTVDGIHTAVQQQSKDAQTLRTDLTTLQQTARDVQISVQTLRDTGISKVRTSTDYTFDENGLKIARSGQPMVNLLDNTGMYVTRAGQPVLQANSDGVVAVDVQVKNYLCVGTNARLEDYESGRTACFWTGG